MWQLQIWGGDFSQFQGIFSTLKQQEKVIVTDFTLKSCKSAAVRYLLIKTTCEGEERKKSGRDSTSANLAVFYDLSLTSWPTQCPITTS